MREKNDIKYKILNLDIYFNFGYLLVFVMLIKKLPVFESCIQISLLELRLKRERRENVSSLYTFFGSRTILRELASVIIFSHFDASTSKRQKSSGLSPHVARG